MNSNIVVNQIIKQYKKLNSDNQIVTWSITECIDIFDDFYTKYQTIFGDHPNISNDTVSRILKNIDKVETPNGSLPLLVPQHYPKMIDLYFKSKYQNCNYSIAHFMNEKIKYHLFLKL